MPAWLIDIMGWVPAIVFPGAALLQLTEAIRAETTRGVSATAWGLCSLANVCAYGYTEKFFEPQALLLLFAAVLQVAIVVVLFLRRKNEIVSD